MGSKQNRRLPMDIRNNIICLLPEGGEICIGRSMRVVIFEDLDSLKAIGHETRMSGQIHLTAKVTGVEWNESQHFAKVTTSSGRIYYVMEEDCKCVGFVKSKPRHKKEMKMYVPYHISKENQSLISFQEVGTGEIEHPESTDGYRTWKWEDVSWRKKEVYICQVV